MKPDYKNWVPKGMVNGLIAGTLAACALSVLFGATDRILHGAARLVCAVVLGAGTLTLLFFAIHDLMSPARYGDMDAFARNLKDTGYEDVRLIDTTDGTFMGHREAAWLGLAGSTLLVGK